MAVIGCGLRTEVLMGGRQQSVQERNGVDEEDLVRRAGGHQDRVAGAKRTPGAQRDGNRHAQPGPAWAVPFGSGRTSTAAPCQSARVSGVRGFQPSGSSRVRPASLPEASILTIE
ncbi:hypothetical protein GCM10027360_89190 [Amycolatopsis echigonensis]